MAADRRMGILSTVRLRKTAAMVIESAIAEAVDGPTQIADDPGVAGRQFYVGSEYIALALIEADVGIAALVLRAVTIRPAELRATIQSVLSPNDGTERMIVGLTLRATAVIALGQERAGARGDGVVRTDDLLWGLIQEGKSVAAFALRASGLAPASFREQLKEVQAAEA